METETAEEPNRRKSGRVVRKPEVFAEEAHVGSILSNGSAKRKRAGHADEEDEIEDGLSSSASGSDDDNEPDEEETRDTRRKTRPTKTSHSAKKPKTNGASTTLAIRSSNLPSKPRPKAAKQKARARPSQMMQEGLFAEVFGRGRNGDEVAADWHNSLENNNVEAVRDFVNFILECIGCEYKVDIHDIEDLDNVPSKLGDILDEFQVNKDAEYPLVSKSKQYTGFRDVLEEFCKALVEALHTSNVFYADEAVFDNIQTWVGTMSAASLRPFRHTATVISLAMSNALCDVANGLQTSNAMSRKQIEAEKGKKTVNKGRVKTIEESITANEKKLEQVDALLKDSFDTVFVHRYRDVDEKIRVDCANALGYWITTYRKMFLEGTYLRYLGWVLSDTNVQTRLEVIRQLKTLFKDRRNVAALRAFTERFRPRLVEMGARDADTTVRTEAVELLDRLRNAELLEPDDIDTIGRLIFDAEPRVRKAVSKFFVSNIEDLYKASIEDLDAEQYNEALLKDSEDYLIPTQAWIKFKCLAQTLLGYDADGESEGGGHSHDVLLDDDPDSRFMLATQSIFPHMEELQGWEFLAGYVLYDHSQIDAASDDPDVTLAVKGCYKLDAREDRILLDVLYMSVKLFLQQVVESQSDPKKGKKTNKAKDEIQEKLADSAHSLAVIVPQLLNKFGTIPSAATSILRLEQLLNIDMVNDLGVGQGDSASTIALLEDINKQFVSHSDRKVLIEASKALRKARAYEQSKEVANVKVQEIWDDSIGTLQNLLRGQNTDSRGTLPVNVLTEVVNTTIRLSNLAGVAQCDAIIERRLPPAVNAKKQKNKTPEMTLLDLLLDLVRRGVPDENTVEQIDELEDELCLSAMGTLSLYFRWKVFAIKTAVEGNEFQSSALSTDSLTSLAIHRQNLIESLIATMRPRAATDRIRINSITTGLDIFTLFATTRHLRPKKGGQNMNDALKSKLRSLVVEVPQELVKEVMTSHAGLERIFAKRTRRKIEGLAKEKEVGIEDAPVDSDDEQEDGHDDDGEDLNELGTGKDAKKAGTLLAEQRLCELTSKIVLALIAGVVTQADVKEKLMLNKTKLGKSYAQVLAYLEEKRPKRETVKPKEIPKEKEPEPLVLEDDDIEDEDEEADGDDEEALRKQGLEEDHDEANGEEAEENEGKDADDEIMGD